MFIVQKSKVGITLEYLADAEEEASNFKVEFGAPSLSTFMTENRLKPQHLTSEVYQKYLNQENPHFKARIMGGLADLWKLEYSKEVFTDLMSGKFPKSSDEFKRIHGYDLKKNGNLITVKGNAQTGIDSLVNGPKSISIEYARGPREKREKIHGAMEKSVEQLLDRLAKQAKPSCKDNDYQDIVPGSTKLIAVRHTHNENRGYEEDGKMQYEPNLHFHLTIQNYAEFELYKHDGEGNRIKNKDGQFITEKKMLAIDPIVMFKQQLENSAVFDTLLNSNLQKEGFITEPCDVDGHPTFQIAGYTREIEESLSKRSNFLDGYIAEQKKLGKIFSSEVHAEREYKKSLRQNTAKAKALHDTTEILENIKQTVDKNISADEQKRIDRIQATTKQTFTQPDLSKVSQSQIFETAGVVDESKVRTLLVQELRFKKNYDSIDELDKDVQNSLHDLQSKKHGKHRLVKMADGRFTRIDIVANEKALFNNIEALKQFNSPALSSDKELAARKFLSDFYRQNKKKNFKLNDGQFQACKGILSENAVSMIIGDAGTGKTTTAIKFANEYHTQVNGAKVYGLSVGTTQSRTLKDADISAENCLNSKEFIQKSFDFKTGEINKRFLNENLNSILVFDEAGMCGSEDMRKITDFVKAVNQSGGKSILIMVGDHKQLQAVSYGNAFLNTQQQLAKADISRLQENTRQRNEVAKAIAEGYKEKDINSVFKTLTENNLLITEKTEEKVIEKLVSDYLNDASKSKLIVCGLNAEIDTINDLVRAGLVEQEKAKRVGDPAYKSPYDFENSKDILVARKAGNGNLVQSKKSFCKGEEIVFFKNFKSKKEDWEISNGDRATIKKIKQVAKDNFELTVEINGKQLSFQSAEYNQFALSHSVSTHKSQGKTVENTYHLGNANQTNFQNTYVNGSRHKDQYKLYLIEDQVELYKKNTTREAVKETTLNDLNCQKAVVEFVSDEINKKRNAPTPMLDFKIKASDNKAQLKLAKEKQEKLDKEQQTQRVRAFKEKEAKDLERHQILDKQRNRGFEAELENKINLEKHKFELEEADRIAKEHVVKLMKDSPEYMGHKITADQLETMRGLGNNLVIKPKPPTLKPPGYRKR